MSGGSRRGGGPGGVPGPVLFARYAYPPNELGYCGPGDPAGLLQMGSAGQEIEALARLAPSFDGAWPYLELIAGCNAIADPLDRRVVEAYWVGNHLLRSVGPPALAAFLERRFPDRAGPVPPGVAHHSLHVFAVYPWLDLLRSGVEVPALGILDRCRIRWGRVEAVDGDSVTVSERRLRWRGSRLELGPTTSGWARRSVDGVGFAGPIEAGDTVSLHWDWVCDRLSPDGLAWLASCTAANLQAVNRTSGARPLP